jgi:hypothetical protein
MIAQKLYLAIILAVLFNIVSGCRVPYADPPVSDSDTDSDGDADTDSDADSDADTDSDADFPDSGPPENCPEGQWDQFDNTDSPYVGGEVKVKVEVSIASEFRCPYCAMFADEMIPLEDKPSFRDYIRIYFHHYPIESLHPGTTEISAASYAVYKQDMEKFWQLHDELFYNSLEGDKWTIEQVTEYAQNTLQLDMAEFEAVRNAQETYDFIDSEREAAQAQGATGTPSVFVCGTKLSSWGDLEEVAEAYLAGDY